LGRGVYWHDWHEMCLPREKSRVKISLAFIRRWVDTSWSITSR
jgi:hypothetical protein